MKKLTPKGYSPLFIALKRHHFSKFAYGKIATEYRRFGSRWNSDTCFVGRRVTLSLGYGKSERRSGVVVGFTIDDSPENIPGWLDCYWPGAGPAACIKIQVDPKPSGRVG